MSLDRGYFYPGEVVRILRLEGMDYRQLRHLFRIVREQAGLPAPSAGEWARFTFRDLVALKTALRLAGGEEALAPGRRLRLLDIERICERLRELGLSNPLAEVAFRRRGRTVIAQVHGLVFEPATGQMVLSEVEEAVRLYLDEQPEARKIELRPLLDQEAQDLRTPRGGRSEARLEVSFRG